MNKQTKRNRAWQLLLAPAILTSSSVIAEEAVVSPINSGDTSWLLISSALVMFMTPGLAFFYGGMVRGKNVVSLIFQSLVALPVITFTWYIVGYSLSFGKGSGLIGGTQWMFFDNVDAAPYSFYGATIPHVLFAIYQCMFAIITPALVSGAFAERLKFKSYLYFLVLWSLFVYSPVCHWVWGEGGFLRDGGTLDFAGGLVVHMTAGFSALAASFALGKRKDFGTADTSPSSVPLIAIGTGILWFGWFGFNGGSAIASNELAVNAFSATHLAACSAMFVWMMLDWIFKGKPNLTGACIGAVVGLVAVTPASGFVTPGSGLLIGALGALVANFAAMLRGNKFDDSLDVFACHGLGGFVGILSVGLLGTTSVNSLGADASSSLFMNQLKSGLIVAVYSFVITFIIFKVIEVIIGNRLSSDEEEEGSDSVDHGEKAYTV